MPRTIRDAKIETPFARAKLELGRKDYWKTLVPAKLHIGYRKRRRDEPGTWLVRRFLGDHTYRVAPLGREDAMSYEEAVAAAYATAEELRLSTTLTVADAIADYIRYLNAFKATGRDAEYRARKTILPELGRIRLSALTSARLNEWRDRLAEAPAYREPPQTPDAKRARRASANRTLTILKAALNRAFEAGKVDDDTAWRRVKPFSKVDAARQAWLSIEEAGRLIAVCDPGFRPLVTAALMTGARYGELIALRVRDYERGKVHIAKSKSGRPRDIVLSHEGVEFFDALVSTRPFDELMFGEWKRSGQSRLMKVAVARAGLPPSLGFHSLRHTWASLAVMNGMPLMVVARNLGHASTAMVEKHYGHLARTYIDEETRRSAPVYGLK